MWTNWSGSVRCTPTEVVHPRSESEVVDVVRRAAAYGERVRVVGSGHSFTPLAKTEGVLVALDRVHGLLEADRDGLSARARGGTTIADLGEPLREAGLALENQGDIDAQTIAGAIGTGTHGTGPAFGSLSTQVESVRLVTASGDVIDCDRAAAPELFGAVRLSLGCLGVITEVELRVVPAYRLHQKTWRTHFDEGMASLESLVGKYRHLEFFWWPQRDRIEFKALDRTEAPPDELPELPWERIDHSHRIFPTVRDAKFNEIEYAIPAELGPECFRRVRERIRAKHRDLLWPVEYRTVRADDVYLSPMFGRDSVTISVHQDAGLPFRDLFRDIESILREADGRPHWGKLHSLGARELAPLFPRWEAFQGVRRELDPNGRFMSEYLERVLGA